MKVLVSGDVNGKFDQLFERVAAVNAKAGPFACLFCVGDFFNTTSKHGADGAKALRYVQGLETIPIPTYFIVSKDSEFALPEEGGEVCHNLHFLGKGGMCNIEGLNVAFVSGCHDPYVQNAGVSTITAYTQRSIKDICAASGSPEFGG